MRPFEKMRSCIVASGESGTGSCGDFPFTRDSFATRWGNRYPWIYIQQPTIASDRSVLNGEIERSVLREETLYVKIVRLHGINFCNVIMMKYVAVLFSVVCLAQSQRPPYAGTSNRYPIVLPQFLEGQVPVGSQAPVANETVVSRIDGDGGGNDTELSKSTMTPISSTIPPDLPVDAMGDIDLINRIMTWPKEKQPFWFLNWQQIQQHRGDANNRAEPPKTQPNARPFFAGQKKQ